MSSNQVDNRLPTNVAPEHYDLTIKTDLSALTFSGTVEIQLAVLENTSSITLNTAAPLELHSANLIHSSLKTENSRSASKIELDEKRERATIQFNGGEIPKGNVRLGLRFSGKLEPSMMGYYLSLYPRKDGSQGFYSLTQFEATQARRAFPCFDEPSIKATYSVSLISRVGTTSLSNTDVNSTKHLGPKGEFPRTDLLTEQFFTENVEVTNVNPGKRKGESANKVFEQTNEFKDDWELVKFNPTPKVSTYLIAFANGEFEHIESSYTSPLTGRKIPMRVYATYDHIQQAGLALETKVRILPIYEKMFDLAYPLPKLDTLVASDFDAGAMENWGLITGRTAAYLYDPKKSGVAAKKRVIGMQSHEVAHQWFGNIVTFKWWDNLWLNEAFATLIGEVIMIQEIEPEWKIHSSFLGEHFARALKLDALRSSHPIEMPCPDEDTIEQIFDAISYSKGASVLKMLSNMLGEKTFLKGVSLYLKEHLYGNAETKDLWAGISKASGKDVAELMYNWTNKVGFPVITVEETSEGLKLTQNRFLATADPTPEEDKTLWHIPLELLSVQGGKTEIDHEKVLSDRSTTIAIKNISDMTYKLNAETCGVYRTLYSVERLSKLGDEAGKPQSAFSVNDRMGLIQDSSVLAESGYSKTSGALSLISKLNKESENLVWQEISTALSSLTATWWEQPKEIRDGLNKLRRELFGPVADKLGFEYSETDSVDTIELRTLSIAVSAAAEDEKTLAEFKRRFEKLVKENDESEIPSDLRTSIFGQSVKNGGETEYNKVLEIYRNPPTPSHKNSAIVGLCSAKDKKLIQQTFKFALGDEVKTQDLAYFVAGLANNREAKRETWTWFTENIEEFTRRFKGNFSIGRIIQASFATLSSHKDADMVEKFFKGQDTSAYSQSLSQGLDAVRSKASWLERDAKDVETWLKENKYI